MEIMRIKDGEMMFTLGNIMETETEYIVYDGADYIGFNKNEYTLFKGENEMIERGLAISEERQAKDNISDLVVYGDTDNFALLCKASSKEQGFMKSTKVCNLTNGCVIQVSTQQKNPDGSYSVAEALTFVPGINMDTTCNPRKLVPIQGN